MMKHFFPFAATTFALIFLGLNSGIGQITVNAGINNQTFSTCNEFIIDSGGQGGPGYSNDENVTFTVCSDNPGDQVTVTFNLFSLSPVDTQPGNGDNSDQMYVFDGPNTSANSLGNYGGTGLQGVVIQATPQNTSGCLTFQFVSNDSGTGSFTASASCNTPCATPMAGGIIVGGITQDSIRVCVGEEITFREQGSMAQPGFNLVGYTWDFMDGSQETVTAPGAEVTHAFSQAGNYLVQLFVQDDNPDNVCLNSNFISLDILVATIPSFAGFQEDVVLCVGEELNFEATPQLYEVTWSGFNGGVEIENGCLPDTLLGISQDIEIFQMGFLAGTTIESINDIESICLDMEHSFMGDIVIYVTCPNGQQVMLHQQGGGGTQIGVPVQEDNINCDDPATQGEAWNYCFTPTATETWVEWVNNSGGFGGTLPEGDYEPLAPLDGLIGCPTNGIWTLTVVDNWAADDGQLVGFALNLDESLYPEVVEYTPQISPDASGSYWTSPAPYAVIDGASMDEITITPTAEGTFEYTYNVIDDFGCSNDTSFFVTVFQALLVQAPDDFTIGCDDLPMVASFQGLPPSSCSDCGEFTYCYSDNDNFTWTFCPDVLNDGTALTFEFIDGAMEAGFEDFLVYDGASTAAPLIEAWSGGDASGQSWTATNTDGCITVSFSADGSISCNGGSYTEWTYSVSNGGPEYEWLWTPATFLNDPTIQSPTIVDLTEPVTYTVSGYPVGHPDCASSDQVVVSLDPAGDPGDSNTITVCATEVSFLMTDSLLGTPSSGGVWTDATGAVIADGMFDPATAVGGVFAHEIPGGCFDPAELTITIYSPLDLSISNDTIICHQGEVSMDVYSLTNGLPPYSYSWTFEGAGVGNGQDIDFAPTGSGQACVDVNDACGYSASECFAIEMLPAVEATFSADTTEGCWPGSFHLAITSDPTTYTNSAWTFTDGSSYFNTNDLEVSFDNPGQYNATLTLSNLVGCEYIANMPLSLVSYAPPVAGYLAGPQPTDIYDTEIHFEDVTSGYPIQSYQWTFSELDGTLLGGSNQANPVFTFPNAFGNNYIVALEVTDIHNCSDMTTGNTVVINDIPQFYIPTGFTPNNDGLNDVLQFIGADIDETRFQFEVFNRFGEKVFESTDPNSAWTGNTANGEYYAPNGVYSWRAIVVSKSTGVKKEINGSIIIMR